jgi:hypothetical protein
MIYLFLILRNNILLEDNSLFSYQFNTFLQYIIFYQQFLDGLEHERDFTRDV